MADYTAIDDPSAYFQSKIYSGTGNSLALTFDGNSNMQPDWLWFKRRDGSANHHAYDSVRGVQKALVPNDTDSETTGSQEGTLYFSSFDSDGFTLAGGGYNNSNKNNQTYVAWGWKETATAGFDIVTWAGNAAEGRNISHSLSAVPHVMIVKNLSASVKWVVYHHKNTTAPGTDYLRLDTTDATADDDSTWDDTVPTSSVFRLKSSSATNGNNANYVAYLFTSKQGYSHHGGYVGNGNTNGAFVYTGFKPAWIMIKASSRAGTWNIYDNQRNPFNSIKDFQVANAAEADVTGNTYQNIDMLSNGFKCLGTGTGTNEAGSSYVYLAFAENPFVTSEGVPGTAR